MITEVKVKLNNNQFSPNAISHRELNSFLSKAKKETQSVDTSKDDKIKENKEFNELISNWMETSQRVLLVLNKKDQVFSKHKSSKELMAFGAMGAHINMALQALKATDFDR